MNKLYSFLYHLCRPFFCAVRPCRLIGRENLPEQGGLFCPNHSGLSDPLCLIAALGARPQLHIMAKAEFMRIPVLGWILKKCGIFSVERGKADVGAVKTAMKYLKNGESVLIFPEGTRIREGVDKYGNPAQAHAGAAMLAVRTGVPLIPVYIPPKKGWFRFTTVVIGEAYVPRVASRKGTAEEYQAIADDLMERVYALGGQV